MKPFSKFQPTKLIPKFLHLLPEQLFRLMFLLIQRFQLERAWQLLAVQELPHLLHQLQLPQRHQLLLHQLLHQLFLLQRQ